VIFICSFNFFNASLASAKFINTFLIKIGGVNFPNNDETAKYLAQYDLIITRKMQSDDIGGSYGSTWKAIKKYNPNCKIHLYAKVNCTHPDSDSTTVYYSNNLARYNVSRGHFDGRLADHNGYFLHRDGKKWIHASDGYLLDPGDAQFRAYSLEATINDYEAQLWSADGVYTDVLHSHMDLFGWSDEYATQSAWSNAVQGLINSLTKGLNAQSQAFTVNHGNSKNTETKTHWTALNAIPNPPDYLLEEGGLAVLYGGGDIQFFGEYEWKNQIAAMVALTNIGVLSAASTDLLDIEDTGTDNFGKKFTGWDALYFAMGSFCLGKDNKDAFFFRPAGPNPSYSNWEYYYDEYDMIDLGSALSNYKVTKYSGINIYWREFQNGYVYVNPTNTNVDAIPLPVACKRRTHANLYKDLDTLPNLDALDLNAHRAAFLYKSTSSLPPPTKLQIID